MGPAPYRHRRGFLVEGFAVVEGFYIVEGIYNLALRVALRVAAQSLRKRAEVVGPLSGEGPEGDGEKLSLVTYWPNK